MSPLLININDLPNLDILTGKESEANWEHRDRIISGLTAYFNEQRAGLDYSLAGMTTFSGSFADLRASFQALPANDLHTPRTQLSIRTCNFIAAFSQFLGPGLFDGYAEGSLSHLIKLSGTTKKIIGNVAADVAKGIASSILPQRTFPVLISGAMDKNVASRLRAFECLKIISERSYDEHQFHLNNSNSTTTTTINNNNVHQKIWESAIEKVLQKGIGDANAEIRSVALNIFLFYKEKTPDSVSRFMEQMDQSTKKQLNLLLAKTFPASKPAKPIVASVPLAQIRKTMLKDTSSSSIASSPTSNERTRSVSPLKSSKSNYEISTPTKTKLSPSKSSYDFSNGKKMTNISPLKQQQQPQQINDYSTDVPMDSISIPPPGSPMKVVVLKDSSCDVFMDANSSSSDNSEEDQEIILNVPNAIVSPSSAHSQKQNIEILTSDLPQKIHLSNQILHSSSSPMRNSFVTIIPSEASPSLASKKEKFSASSPSIPSRVKSLGLVSGTPLRTIYRNFSLTSSNNLSSAFNSNSSASYSMSSSLLNDLIEEYHNTLDSNCLKKIFSLTSVRSGDFDHLNSDLVQKLFINKHQQLQPLMNVEYHLKIILNFLKNEPFLLSSSCREIIEMLENVNNDNCNGGDILEISKIICKTNLLPILMENCIDSCYEKLSEFKLILLAESTRNFIDKADLSHLLNRSITPLLLALNHPDLNIRRLSMNCFLEARNKLGLEGVLTLLNNQNNSTGLVQKKLIEGFLRQF